MKIVNERIKVQTTGHFQFVNLDAQIQLAVDKSEIKEGFLLLRSPHNTATIVCLDNNPAERDELKSTLSRLVMFDLDWDKAPREVKAERARQAAAIIGQAHWSPIIGGKIGLGPWQSFFLLEFLEGRERLFEIAIVGENP